MLSGFLSSVQDNVWAVFLIAVFFGGSIFVHEMGHFLAARRHGLKVERFSIGFGPAIWSHRGKDGVEYRLSWFPLGGYVLLPQLADLRAIEGKSDYAESTDPALPPVAYGPKMIVFAAGAAFNVLFAFALACIVSVAGLPESSDQFSGTTIGAVSKTVEMPDGTKFPSPASEAGLQVGDIIRSIDGKAVQDFSDITALVVLSGSRDAAGHPEARFQVERAGKTLDLTLHPRLTGADNARQVGIGPAFTPIVHKVTAGSAADKAGFKDGDVLDRMEGAKITSISPFFEYLQAKKGAPAPIQVLRDGRPVTLTLTGAAGANGLFGFASFTSPTKIGHPSPFKLVWDEAVRTGRTIASLLNPHSDVGLSKMSGVIGIVHIYHDEAQQGLIPIMGLTILINVNLAILNLLPIPVLDGGQMVFATIGWIRGRSLPVNFIMTAQSVFMVLILILMVYIGYFDVQRLMHS
jgi:regulator of sigma E protease